MRVRSTAIVCIVFLCGAILSGLFSDRFGGRTDTLLPAAHAQAPAPKPDLNPAALHAEIERLKAIVPDQAHAMQDVEYHFTNLWFAGKAKNWPLAEFYWKETLSHLHWAVRMIPVRKDNAGREINRDDSDDAYGRSHQRAKRRQIRTDLSCVTRRVSPLP